MADAAKQETIVYGRAAVAATGSDFEDMTTTPPLAAASVSAAVGQGASDPALPVVPPPPDLTGTLLLERYRLLRKLGVGGMGTVYEAEHVTIKKRCAIKILNPEFAHRPELVERFLQEARAASMIGHENVVEITDFGATPTGSVFFVMEMLVGEDLSETIKREGPLPWPRAAAMTLQICRALQAAHDKGIIHRDMKPENCFRIERSGNPDFIKVLDFGIAKLTGDDGNARLTSTGMIFGTPTYMSPEQAQGMRVDHRADVYAVGVILYELVTGKVPFTADNFMGILTKHMFEDPPAPSELAPEAEITPEEEAIILKALQKDRDLRFQTLREFMEAIQGLGGDAAPVIVVPERRNSRPNTGPTKFAPRAEDFRMSTAPSLPPTVETLAPRRGGRLGVLAAIVVIVGGLGVAAYGLSSDPAPTEPVPRDIPAPVVVAAPDPPEPAVPIAPETIEPPAAPAPVRVVLATNTPAEVFDASGATRLGASGEDLALTGPGPHKLLLKAAQHEDLTIEVKDPSEGQRLEFTLRPKTALRPSGSGKKPAVTKVTKPPKEQDGGKKPPPDTKDPPPDTQGGGTKFGLKNPFEKVGG